MALKVTQKVAVPEGVQTGEIVSARESTRDFGKQDEEGITIMEPTVEVVIRPDYKVPGKETLDLQVLFTPEINGLSALSQLLERLQIPVTNGEEFNVERLNGTRVVFKAFKQPHSVFMRVDKNSIALARGPST